MNVTIRDATFHQSGIPQRPPALLHTQFLEVMEAIRTRSHDPKEFNWDADSTKDVACLVHRKSNYFFSFAPKVNDGESFTLRLSPGGVYQKERYEKVREWKHALVLFEEWLIYLGPQMRAADIFRSWVDEVESVTESDFKQPKLLESLPDRRFTVEEQNTIRGLVEDFVATVKIDTEHRDEMTEAQVRLLNAQADVAIEQAKGMKVRRWFLVLGTLYASWNQILDGSPALEEWSTKVLSFIEQIAQKLISENG